MNHMAHADCTAQLTAQQCTQTTKFPAGKAQGILWGESQKKKDAYCGVSTTAPCTTLWSCMSRIEPKVTWTNQI